MRNAAMTGEPAALHGARLQRAGASAPPLAQTAWDLGSPEHPRHPWLGNDHRAARQTPPVPDAPLADEHALTTQGRGCPETC